VLPESLTYIFNDPYAAALLRGIAQATEPQALSVLLVPVPVGHLQEQAVRRAVVDAFCIYTMPVGQPVIDIALCRNAPVIFADGPELADHPFVGTDEHAAGRAIAEHLITRGRRRLGVVTFRVADDDATGEADDARTANGTFRSSVDRLRGVLAAAADAGLARTDVRIYEAGLNVPEGGRRAAARLLDVPQPPDAIVCLSDRLAAGALEELAARGRAVPGDVAVTGWDDMQIASDLDLTTVRQPNEEKGRIAGQWMVEGVRGPRREILSTEIIVRGSSGG
jgi:DNA-binding LacI/PurR family transcriptional regulator